jgi:hypothetical protein
VAGLDAFEGAPCWDHDRGLAGAGAEAVDGEPII